jgi:uncharacterized SAM-dependent methyltransferase
MTRHERDQFFDALCELRERYGLRADADRLGIHSIEEVVRWAEHQMVALGPAEASVSGQEDEANASRRPYPES